MEFITYNKNILSRWVLFDITAEKVASKFPSKNGIILVDSLKGSSILNIWALQKSNGDDYKETAF